MFGFRKKRKQVDTPFVEPTAKQLKYARVLRIPGPAKISKKELSAAIDAAEEKNPKARRERAAVVEKRRIEESGPELIEAETQWDEFSDNVRYMLAIYERGKETIVDVLTVDDVCIEGAKKKKLKLYVCAPKLVKDKHIGDYLEWEQCFTLSIEKLRYYEPLRADFDTAGLAAYQKVVKRGMKEARKL